jgi:hypothetical protein
MEQNVLSFEKSCDDGGILQFVGAYTAFVLKGLPFLFFTMRLIRKTVKRGSLFILYVQHHHMIVQKVRNLKI